jgi:methane monooxygenase component A alpha chain/propane monooxygenase large subunit
MTVLSKSYDRVKSMDWEPSYIDPALKYVEPTRFHLPKKAVDPFKTFVREYFQMEREKDNRHFAMLEAASRFQSSAPEPRWMEAMKFVLSNLSSVEYSAGRQMGRMARVVAPPELRQGYMMQALDEMRHTQLELGTLRHHMRTWEDPAGYDIALYGTSTNLGAGIFRAFIEDSLTCDPVETSLAIQVFGETATTNMFFIGMTTAATLSGDPVLASTLLTIQSDEARHMANGYATLVTLLSDDRNIPLVQDVMDKWSWRNHVGFEVPLLLAADYFTKHKTESGKEMYQRWILEDFYGNFYRKLEKYGIKQPLWMDHILRNIEWASHSAAVYLFGAWPEFYHRYDPPDEREMDWFEQKYPGWYSYYGKFWENYRESMDPRNRKFILSDLGKLPAFCRVCQLPWIFPRPDASAGRRMWKDGQWLVFCSPGCEWIYNREPEHYRGFKTFYDIYDGWEFSEVVRDLGYIRPDGKTLIAQPWLDREHMWTSEDLKACNYLVRSPLHDAPIFTGDRSEELVDQAKL